MRFYCTAFAIVSMLAAHESSESSPIKKMSEIMQVKKLSEFAIIPTRGSQYAAGNSKNTRRTLDKLEKDYRSELEAW